MDLINVAEIFYSIQGEGKLLGVPSVFVRTSGCNLRCTWCDTPYASWSPKRNPMLMDEIVERVRAYPAKHVVVTGGEPMMVPQIAELIGRLNAMGKHVTLETAGTLWFGQGSCPPIGLASISPKLSNSTPREREGGKFVKMHEAGRIDLEVLKRFADAPEIEQMQWKFVVTGPENVVEIEGLLGEIGPIDASDVLLMPEGTTVESLGERGPWLAEICKTKGYRFAPRLHIYLYGNKAGT